MERTRGDRRGRSRGVVVDSEVVRVWWWINGGRREMRVCIACDA